MGCLLRRALNPALGRSRKARKAERRCDARSKRAIAFSRDAMHGVSTVTTLQSHGGTVRTCRRRPTLWRATGRFFLELWIELSDDKGECPKKGKTNSEE